MCGNEENIFTYNKDSLGKVLHQHQAATEPYSIEQPFKVLDFGFSYIKISNLAIWLIKWAAKFQKIMMNHKSAASFWYTNETDQNSTTTLKLTSINSNFLVSCVFLANDNNLEHSALYLKQNQEVTANNIQAVRRTETIDDDFTQISNSVSVTSRRNLTKVSKLQQQDEPSSLSTTLDISSFTENQVKHFSNLSSSRRRSSVHSRNNSIVNQKPILQTQEFDFYGNVTSRTDVTVDSTINASEYYNLKDLQVNQSMTSARKETPRESFRDSFRDSSVVGNSARAQNENKSFILGEFDTKFFKL